MPSRKPEPSPQLIADSTEFVRGCFADSENPPSEKDILSAGRKVADQMAVYEKMGLFRSQQVPA